MDEEKILEKICRADDQSDDTSGKEEPAFSGEMGKQLVFLSPDRLKADIISPFEIFNIFLVGGTAGLFVFLIINQFFYDFLETDIPFLLFLLLVAVSCVLMAGAVNLSDNTDIYYLINRTTKTIYLHRKILNYQAVTPALRFSQIQCVTVSAYHYDKESHEWSYHVAVVKDDGGLMTIAGPSDDFEECNDIADKLAWFMGVKSRDGEEEKYVTADAADPYHSGSKASLSHSQFSQIDKFFLGIGLIMLLFVLGILYLVFFRMETLVGMFS